MDSFRKIFLLFILGFASTGFVGTAFAQSGDISFQQGILENTRKFPKIAAFYEQNAYDRVWTAKTRKAGQRRDVLFAAIETAHMHGLPQSRYDKSALYKMIKNMRSPRDAAKAEVAFSRAFLLYARDLQTGAVEPSEADSDIKRRRLGLNTLGTLQNFVKSNPRAYLAAMAPKSREYRQLLSEKQRMTQIAAQGGWGPRVPEGKTLRPGDSGKAIVALRNRLQRMGYLGRTLTKSYDTDLQQAVARFQKAHGLNTDGVAGPVTLSEVNVSAKQRIRAIAVALERERWLRRQSKGRYVVVNIADFTAKIMDGDRVTFSTRSVVGATGEDRRSPEFSDVMEFMVINPTWNVPRSIAVKEYLPMLKRDPYAVSNLNLIDRSGRVLSREGIDFTQYTKATFPFSLKEPPSAGNALGRVKFMFPNPYNIYLHDTPSRSLFAKETRTFSHGCIRLQDPLGFAHTILARQSGDPEGLFDKHLRTGKEKFVNLKNEIPVHLIYRTAFTNDRGEVRFRRDIYGRDAKIFQALVNAGLELSV